MVRLEYLGFPPMLTWVCAPTWWPLAGRLHLLMLWPMSHPWE
jgi:hypothetical protein